MYDERLSSHLFWVLGVNVIAEGFKKSTGNLKMGKYVILFLKNNFALICFIAS